MQLDTPLHMYGYSTSEKDQRQMTKLLRVQNGSLVTSYPEWHFDVLTAPYFHFFIVASNMVEIFFRDGEETTSKCGSPIEKFC